MNIRVAPIKGPSAGQRRVLRGGSYVNYAVFVRAADRLFDVLSDGYVNFGFRLARSAR